jgi:hypothetical protein
MIQKLCHSPRNLPAIEAKYIANRSVSGTVVMVQTEKGREQLRPRFDLIRHHPVGFDWAHTGSGPAQLALALLAHASGDDEFALEQYQIFQHEIIARLPKGGWELTSQQVLQMLRFVSQGTHAELISLQPAPLKPRKTAVIHALLPSRSQNSQITARGSARSIGEAVTRAIRNLLRDTRLRRTTIVNLQIELSVVNTEPEVEQRIADGDAYLGG